MTVKVYADVLFILNFIIDYLLLRVTALLLHKKSKHMRFIFAAAFGALYAAVIFFLPISRLCALPLSVFVSFFMTAIAFGPKTISFFVKSSFLFYLICIASAGTAFLAAQTPTASILLTPGAIYADVDAYMLLFAFVVASVIVHFSCSIIKKQRIKARYLYQVTVEKDGKTVSNTALFDTGNFITEPLTQKSVMLAEWSAVQPLFGTKDLKESIVKTPSEFLYIPCHTAGGRTGMFAFCPDRVTSSEISLPDAVYIGITEQSLDAEGNYQMILPNSAEEVSESERMSV